MRKRKAQRPPRSGNSSRIFRPLPGDVDAAVNRCLEEGSFNFGLYFNKWLRVTEVEAKNEPLIQYNFQVRPVTAGQGAGAQKYQLSEVLENFDRLRGKLSEVLKKRRELIDNACSAFKKLGYSELSFEAELRTALIVGLGNASPVERGFTLHWTMGIPYIPAESVKGVVRLAFLVEKAGEDDGFFKHWADEDGDYLLAVRNLFGCPEGRSQEDRVPSHRGKVVFLDALPLDVPKFTAEITTCHYGDYYAGLRGPAEDQNPNPVPFLAVAPGVRFRFVMLTAQELPQTERKELEKAFKAALQEHGFGAKTALGHGRFSL
ncbi:type III-B CRISPR module RAMP protein Cmr6 [Thermodesulforhabdus norvegica]|uniref:CRISPR-associated protein Cmr6 n=1 Tax=Thermodesulforhabdus norvegica TaxID=39841 RepID=A0A1I4TAN2_9BACT|nr:type III-B CRISPR module RAMP protein Cmr6 [Thermodesulforhabdus norvegica]SFM73772.1 CRISPR-associated protein Cmr6 [Thermodesulforhabdus norvegica]